VLLAGRGEPEAEDAVRASGADLTIVRSTWFAQNFSEDYLVDGVRSGEVALPAGDVPEPFVDADDIADVAVAALTDDRHIGEVYTLTGPRLLTFAEALREIAQRQARGRRAARARPRAARLQRLRTRGSRHRRLDPGHHAGRLSAGSARPAVRSAPPGPPHLRASGSRHRRPRRNTT